MVDRLQAELQLARTQCSSFQRALWMSLNLPKASNNARCTRWSGKGAQAASKSAHVDTHMDELHSTIQQLTQSKARMQSSMLEQITSFRSQLEVVAEENKQLRHELTLLNQAAASRVSSNESGGFSSIHQQGQGHLAENAAVTITSNLALFQGTESFYPIPCAPQVQERSEALLQQQRKALEDGDDPFATRPALGPYNATLHTTTTASPTRPRSASAATARNVREGREIVRGGALNSLQESAGLLPKFRRRASSARRKDDEDSTSRWEATLNVLPSACWPGLGSWEWFASVRLARLVLGYQPGQPGHLSKSNSFSTSPAQLACIALDACCAVRVRATQEGA
eukprot:1145394-Pelagomonas_calceolata.AAC.7